VSLTPEALAALITENVVRGVRDELAPILEQLQPQAAEWITAKECARRWGHQPRYYRDHAAEFTPRREGDGPRPRLLFEAGHVERVLAARRL
jgi:hypothetical protein